MKKYTIVVAIEEGSDEFWEQLKEEHKTGCDEVIEMIVLSLQSSGIYPNKIKLVKFEDD